MMQVTKTGITVHTYNYRNLTEMPQLPVLIDTKSGEQSQLADFPFVVGRSQRAHWPIISPGVARRHFQITQTAGRLVIEPLDGEIQVNQKVITGPFPVEQSVEITLAGLKLLLSIPSSISPTIAPMQPLSRPTIQPAPVYPGLNSVHTSISEGDLEEDEVAVVIQDHRLCARMIAGRDVSRVQIHLPHGMVSRQHAVFEFDQQTLSVSDLNSANGTFVDGARIKSKVIVPVGSHVNIGPYSLKFDGRQLRHQSRENNINLLASMVSRVVRDPKTGQSNTILHRINLLAEPGEFVCILGPSGSGKSTLLSLLSGRSAPSDGKVLLNGQDLHLNFDSLRSDIAFVPQKDCMHDLLSVEQAWRYTAKLRLPGDTSETEIERTIQQMLEKVDMTEHQHKQIRHLSGGQLKRAALGNEMLAKPSLLFLDEVTSGLDEQTDRDMMALFNKIALERKTVICVTHNLANVETSCKRIIVLTAGGRLAFVGSPQSAMKYFDIERLGDIYRILQTKPAESWRNQYQESPHYAVEIESRIPLNLLNNAEPPRLKRIDTKKELAGLFSQGPVLISRYSRMLLTDWLNLAAVAGQSLLVALLIVLLFGNLSLIDVNDATDADTLLRAGFTFAPVEVKRAEYAQKILFLMCISCFWFGCNNSAKEIVKERELFKRERDVNLSSLAYFFSKIVILSSVVAVQVLILFASVAYFCALPGGSAYQFLVLTVLALTGVAMGLLISTFSKTVDVAVAAVPIVLIPQIILAGFIAPLKGAMLLISGAIVPCNAGFSALCATLPAPLNEIADHHEVSIMLWIMTLVVQAVILSCASVLWLNGDHLSVRQFMFRRYPLH